MCYDMVHFVVRRADCMVIVWISLELRWSTVRLTGYETKPAATDDLWMDKLYRASILAYDSVSRQTPNSKRHLSPPGMDP